MAPASFHMSPDEFRRRGREAVDWVADYLERIESFPVLSQIAPGEVRSKLPPSAPEHPEPFEEVLKDLNEIILPGITHWQSPNFFAFFPGNSSGPSVLGELLSAGLGVQGMLWATSPACTELEAHVLDWLAELLGLPERFRSTASGGGVIQDSASSATLCALLAARERATKGSSNERGITDRLTVYASSQAHSSVEKAVRIAGIGSANLRKVEVDNALAMRPDDLARLVDEDAADGALPVMVVATVGTTSTMAVDALPEIVAVCRKRGLWLHADAAMAGTAAICPELRWIHDGLEGADHAHLNLPRPAH
ncbi:MAG: pyridoxal-dependent decarboxylase [Actinomycetota bacterium]